MQMFSKHVGIEDSNEVEVLTILGALHLLHSLYCQNLIVESDSANGICWMKSSRRPRKMQFLFNEISLLVSELQVSFQLVSISPNGMVDCLGVDRSCNLSAQIMQSGLVVGISLLYWFTLEWCCCMLI